MKENAIVNRYCIQLHGIIVTHPDGDHLNGIHALLEKHDQNIQEYDIVLTEALYWRSTHRICIKFTKLINSMCYSILPARGTFGELRPGLKCYFPTVPGCLFKCAQNFSTHVQPSEPFLMEKPEGIDANETSILTAINESKRKCDVVLTGDSRADLILPLVEGKEIRIFQVPHHGSSSNSKLKDRYKLRWYSFIHFSEICKIHDEEVKDIFVFYSTFRAQCYLISAGGTQNYKHPHSSVLKGIILANAFRRQECVILLTNSRGLDSDKVKELHQLVPKWTRYVTIFHYNDVFFIDQCHSSLDPGIECHTRLRPEESIRDVHTSTATVKWTPEEYICKIREWLSLVGKKLIGCRPLERNRFIDRSTVEITIQCGTHITFEAHIICVPLPHNPRSGDSINCCYVIEESIGHKVDFSQALFLQNEGTRSLSRARNYILFQYINNEWQQKQLPVTVQDSLPKNFPCHIPHCDIDSCWPVCCICSDIIDDTPIVRCCHRLCPSRAHRKCVGYRDATSYICPQHTCCKCKSDIVQDYGTVSCNRRSQGCLSRAHAECVGYTPRGASRVTRFSCPSCR